MGVRHAIVYARDDGAESYPIPTPVIQVQSGYHLFRPPASPGSSKQSLPNEGGDPFLHLVTGQRPVLSRLKYSIDKRGVLFAVPQLFTIHRRSVQSTAGLLLSA